MSAPAYGTCAHGHVYLCVGLHASYVFVWILRIMNLFMDLHLLTVISDMEIKKVNALFYYVWEKDIIRKSEWEKEKKKEREGYVVRGLEYF